MILYGQNYVILFISEFIYKTVFLDIQFKQNVKNMNKFNQLIHSRE